jgi:antitoxin HicB
MEVMEDEGAWVASVPDLPGCNSFGATVADAVSNVQQAKELWMQSQFQSGGEIPEPTDDDGFSGRFVLRIPRILHRSLAYEASRQGVSLNHYASHLLSQGQPLNVVRALLQTRQDIWQNTWVQKHQTAQYKIVSMGGKLPGDVDFVMHLRKPAPKCRFKAPEFSDSIKQQYLLK